MTRRGRATASGRAARLGGSIGVAETVHSDEGSIAANPLASTGPSTGAPAVIDDDERLLRRGEEVGRFVTIERLGSGGMGVVWSAYDPELDRKVALKLLRPELHGHGAAPARDLLLREAQAMARLSHPAVVTVHEVGEHRGAVYIAMEFVAGQTLRQWLEAGHRRWRAVVDMFLQAGRGLMAAHEAGLVHRDFKPEKLVARAPSAPLGVSVRADLARCRR